MTIRSDRTGFGPLFDAADSTAPVSVRTVSTVAPQALFLLNHPFATSQAAAFRRPRAEGEDRSGRTARPGSSDRLLSGRPTMPEESRLGTEFVNAGANRARKLDRVVPPIDPGQRIRGDRMTTTDLLPHRRHALFTFANGFGLIGLANLLQANEGATTDALAVRKPHFAPKAKRVIFLFMSGGPSHVDLFDPKPRLADDNGKPLPFEKPKLERTKTGNLLGLAVQVREARPVRHRSQRAVPARRRLRRRPVRHPLDGRRQHQPQRRLPADEHRRAGVLAAEPGLVAALRPGQREPEPARLRRHQPAPAGPGRAALELAASCRPPTRARWSPT